ncbi:MAG: hypothetical protein ACJ0FS_02030 [Gammaproteobacteria bacterium]|tara:strand:+ start:574 stop:1110 length:537 start_codon:yes stop_codon:yes gene_type:complete
MQKIYFISVLIISIFLTAESIKNKQFNDSEITRKYEQMAKNIKQFNKSKIAIIANKKMSIQLNELKTKLNNNEVSSEILIVENDLDSKISKFLNISLGERKYEQLSNSGIEELKLVYRAREDFDYIHIISNDEYELYQIAAYVRFNFGLNYEITTFREYYEQEFDRYEMRVQQIKLVE